MIHPQEVITPGNKRSVFIVNLHSELNQTFTCLHLIQNKSLPADGNVMKMRRE